MPRSEAEKLARRYGLKLARPVSSSRWRPEPSARSPAVPAVA